VATFVVIQFYLFLDYQMLLHTPLIGLASAALFSVLIGAFVAMVELLTPGQYDNLVIPLGTAALLISIGLG
jgi:dolichol kinase